MKKIVILAWMLCSYGLGEAQGIFIRLGGGYALSTSSQPLENTYRSTSISSINSSSSSSSYNTKMTTLGQGFNGEFSLGYMLGESMGIGLDINYFSGGKITNEFNNSSTINGASAQSKEIIKSYGSYISFAPVFILQVNSEAGISPYFKGGVIFAIPKAISEINDTSIDNIPPTTSNTTIVEKLETTGNMAIGFKAGLGVLFKVSQKLGIFTELNLSSLSWFPKETKLTQSTENGVDRLSTLSIREKHIIYKDEYSVSFSSSPNQNVPMETLKSSLPFNSIGINIGLNLKF